MNRIQLAGPAETVGVGGTLSIVTLTEFLAYISETPDGATNDAFLQTMLDSACYGTFAHLGGRYLLRDATEFDFVMHSQDNGDTLFLHQYPLGTISTIELGHMSADGTWTSTQTITSSDYYADSRSGRVYGTWPTTLHSVRVSWPGGYTTVPADAKEAVMMWAGVKADRARRSRWDVKTLQAATEGYSYHESDIPPAAAAILQRYTLAEMSAT